MAPSSRMISTASGSVWKTRTCTVEAASSSPKMPSLRSCGVRGLYPADLGVRQVRVGGDEALQQEAQGHAQGEREEDAAQDQEVQVPA